jgi:hypothetical protein
VSNVVIMEKERKVRTRGNCTCSFSDGLASCRGLFRGDQEHELLCLQITTILYQNRVKNLWIIMSDLSLPNQTTTHSYI